MITEGCGMDAEKARRTIEVWDRNRAFGKSRLIFLLAGLFSGWIFIALTLYGAASDGTGPGLGEVLGELLACVLAGALFTYGAVSLFVAFFLLVPIAPALFLDAGIPHRDMTRALP